MVTKSPGQCDGKPIGTPMQRVSPQRAGCTFGLDSIERANKERRERNKRNRRAGGFNLPPYNPKPDSVTFSKDIYKRHHKTIRRLCRIGFKVREISSLLYLSQDYVMWHIRKALQRNPRFRAHCRQRRIEGP